MTKAGPILEAVFYARFHPEKGPSVIEEYPTGSIATRAGTEPTNGAHDGQAQSDKSGQSLVNFSDISSYIIPPYDLCGKSLSVGVGGYRVLGWPISLENEQYARNRFTFNLCFVLRGQPEMGETVEGGHKDADDGIGTSLSSWQQISKKTALFLKALEVDDGVLAAEEKQNEIMGGGTVVQRLLESIFKQLNNYGEACIRMSKTHTLNLRLSEPEPRSPTPKLKVHAHDVPLLIRPLPTQESWTYDLVLARILPYIDGIHHIAKIASLAEADMKFVKRAIRSLVALDRVKLLDLFHFEAIYKLTGDFEWFVKDESMKDECRRYVCVASSQRDGKIRAPVESEAAAPAIGTAKHLLTLYSSLSSSPNVHSFTLTNSAVLTAAEIDIRRFVTFGVLKGFLRRVHKYAIAAPSSTIPQTKTSGSSGGKFGSGSGGKRSNEDAAREFDRAWRKAALSSGWATPPSEAQLGQSFGMVKRASPEKGLLHSEGQGAEEGEKAEVSAEDERLRGFLDGRHCLDEICVAMRMSERKLLEKLRGEAGRKVFGDVVVFCK